MKDCHCFKEGHLSVVSSPGWMLLSRSSLSSLLQRKEKKKRVSIHSGSAPVDWSVRLCRFTSWIYSLQLEGRPFSRPLWESRSSCDDFTGSSCKKTSRRGGSPCTLNLIAAWFDTPPPSAVSSYLIEPTFKEIKRCIHFSLWSHLSLIHVNQREAGRDHWNVPSSSYVWSLATENGLLYEASSCV